ncbi:hypothetical protein EDC96DRAFT_530855, partial [Choanephora cucurbitarum]
MSESNWVTILALSTAITIDNISVLWFCLLLWLHLFIALLASLVLVITNRNIAFMINLMLPLLCIHQISLPCFNVKFNH